jgi:hypothetical protein
LYDLLKVAINAEEEQRRHHKQKHRGDHDRQVPSSLRQLDHDIYQNFIVGLNNYKPIWSVGNTGLKIVQEM